MRTEQWVPLPTDALSARPDEALYGVIWVAAVTLTGWLAVTTVASVVVRITRIPRAIRVVDWCTHPAIRRLSQRVAALTLAATSLATPGVVAASETPPIPVVVVTDQPTTTTSGEVAHTDDSVSPSPPPTPNTATPANDEAHSATVIDAVNTRFWASKSYATALVDAPSRYTVKPGDNMWTITAEYLEDRLGARPTSVQTSVVWRMVMDLNRATLRSGDVDLIFPGEHLLLPPITLVR